MNETMDILRGIASEAGWDEYTLLLQICRALEESGQADSLVQTLSDQAREED